MTPRLLLLSLLPFVLTLSSICAAGEIERHSLNQFESLQAKRAAAIRVAWEQSVNRASFMLALKDFHESEAALDPQAAQRLLRFQEEVGKRDRADHRGGKKAPPAADDEAALYELALMSEMAEAATAVRLLPQNQRAQHLAQWRLAHAAEFQELARKVAERDEAPNSQPAARSVKNYSNLLPMQRDFQEAEEMLRREEARIAQSLVAAPRQERLKELAALRGEASEELERRRLLADEEAMREDL